MYVSHPREKESLSFSDCSTDIPGELVGGKIVSDSAPKIGVRADEDMLWSTLGKCSLYTGPMQKPFGVSVMQCHCLLLIWSVKPRPAMCLETHVSHGNMVLCPLPSHYLSFMPRRLNLYALALKDLAHRLINVHHHAGSPRSIPAWSPAVCAVSLHCYQTAISRKFMFWCINLNYSWCEITSHCTLSYTKQTFKIRDPTIWVVFLHSVIFN